MIDLKLINATVVDQLHKAGWSNNRRIDPSEWISNLSQEGYTVFPYAWEVLAQFGGISIRPDRNTKSVGSPGDIDFDPSELCGEFDRLSDVVNKTVENVFPLGMVYGQWFMYVGESKQIYMAWNEKVYQLGQGIEDFLNNVISGEARAVELV